MRASSALSTTGRRSCMSTIPSVEAGGHGDAVLPYLYDACVITMQADWMRVSGFYFDGHSKNALMQNWHVIVLANDYREWVVKQSLEKQLLHKTELTTNGKLGMRVDGIE